jgi:uncharacterized membrane protein
MSSNQPQSSSKIGKIIAIIVAVLVVVFCAIPVCVITILTLLGPQIANVFSRVTSGLGGP